MNGNTIGWLVVAKSPAGRVLTYAREPFGSRDEAEIEIPSAKMKAFAFFAANPTIAIDDDGFADDLYDMLHCKGVQFVPMELSDDLKKELGLC